MSLADKSVLIVGGGIAGLTSAMELAALGIQVDLIENTPFLGGHAIQLACKATQGCVKCGACLTEDVLQQVLDHPRISLHTGCQLKKVTRKDQFRIECDQQPPAIDSQKCSGCGVCLEKCPAERAIQRGTSGLQRPFYHISRAHCLFFRDNSCQICREACPEGAITLDTASPQPLACTADAVVIASGFSPYDPEEKPYGYRRYKNVITSLEMERIMRRQASLPLPSDGTPPERIGFVQCVGSRDAKCKHLWCSKICCGSALRSASWIKSKYPDIDITVFYIDIQTFGKDFENFYRGFSPQIEMIRALPGDIFETENNRLEVNYFDPAAHVSKEEPFDLIILSVGLTPAPGIRQLADQFALDLRETGWALQDSANGGGVYTAGSVSGPMSIPESMENARKTVFEISQYLHAL